MFCMCVHINEIFVLKSHSIVDDAGVEEFR